MACDALRALQHVKCGGSPHMVGVEAMSLGRPIVAFDSGGVTEWLRDGVNGYAVPPGDTDALSGSPQQDDRVQGGDVDPAHGDTDLVAPGPTEDGVETRLDQNGKKRLP